MNTRETLLELASYAWLKSKGWLAYQLVRWFPLPLGLSPRNPIYRLSAHLWGNAYFAGEVHSIKDWREVWLPLMRGGRP